MRNLAVHTHVIKNFADRTDLQELLTGNFHCCANPDNDDLYVLKDQRLCEISSKNGLIVNFVDIDVESTAKPVGLEYSSDAEQLWCAYDTGPIISMNLAPKFHQDATNLMPEGIKCMKLSPDQEILVLITSEDIVVTLISNFHVISKVDLNSTNYGKNQFVTVGWGKKETQFHGTEGKAAAKATNIIVGKTVDDDEKPRISWRGDGTMFAVSFYRDESSSRFFKIFNREGVLQCTSELTSGLEREISWKPSGNLIATSQILPNKHVVAFFEKNGLKHRELVLPFKPNDYIIISIQWSQDSDILSIWLKERDNEETRLQLWTENNYHWYLKQTIKFTAKNPLIYFTWSTAPRAGKRLILLRKENTMIYSFRWNVNHSRGLEKNDAGIVGVVDGNGALITRFRDGIVPPPMAHENLTFDEAINSLIFAPGLVDVDTWLDSNIFMCLLSDNRLAMYLNSKDSDSLDHKNVRTYDIEWKTPVIDDTSNYSLHHFLWFKDNIILCSASSGDDNYLCVLDLEGNDFRNDGRIVVSETYPVDTNIEHIVSSPDTSVAYVLTERTIFKYTTEDALSPMSMELPESCNFVEIITIKDRHKLLSLTSRGRFFVDGNEMASNITSFTVNSDFLLMTTLQHTLICVRLDDDGFRQLNQDLTIKPWENGCKDTTQLSVRRVERGSILIIAISKDPRTILQMPRGNLECIQPRALSLFIIGALLDDLDYSRAFDLIRKQRINLNIIYDHDPSLFIENAEKFVADVKNPAWLSLFISELQNDNVTETIYKSSYGTRVIFANENVAYLRDGKIERVCEILRGIMEKRDDSEKLIQPILTSLVKNQRTPGLEAALRKIKEVRSHEDTSIEGKKSSSEDALRYLLYLVDVNVLFDIALGMYDFELALFVASKSQKDPKEYIPLLNDLKMREVNYMKYSIDKYLKRYESALNHIARANEKFDECLEFIFNHDMYAKALKIFSADSEEYRQIAKMYGDVLMKREKYYEAGIMYSRSWYLKNALCAYKAAGSWQDAIVVAMQLDFGPRDLQELYTELVSYLNQEKRYREAADILVTYLKQHEDAVSVLCEGKQWRDATRIAHSIKRLDLIETHVKPGVGEHAAYLIYATNRNREKFEKHKIRLATVRQENAARDLRMQETLGADFDYTTGREISDLLSDTSSVAGSLASQSSRSSRSSGRTYRSSKNRRKQERKLLSIKEGSFFEDLALIRALHQIITTTYADKDDVKLVTQMSLNFGNDEIAEKLQNTFGEFMNFIERSKNEIWPKSLNDSLDTRDEPICFKDNQPNNIPQSLLEPRFMYPPDGGNSVWQLDIFDEVKSTFG